MSQLGVFFGKMLSGESVIREFSTVGIDDNIRERVYLDMGAQVLDVSGNQWLIALDPRVIGIWLSGTEKEELASRKCRLCFRDGQDDLAVVDLIFFNAVAENDGTLFLFQVTHSDIRHIHLLKARLLYWKFYRKPGVDFERLKAVAAAYTYPRRVRIISFRLDEDYNYIFPMDLLGDLRAQKRYLLGMRHSNAVLRNIMDVKKIVVSEVPAEYKWQIYKLGRNHSAAPPPIAELPFGVVTTREFGFLIPDWAESYKEIHIRRALDLGSHMLLWGQWDEDIILKDATPRLHHIHFLHFLHQKKDGAAAYPMVSGNTTLG
jgi:hypothetical protein